MGKQIRLLNTLMLCCFLLPLSLLAQQDKTVPPTQDKSIQPASQTVKTQVQTETHATPVKSVSPQNSEPNYEKMFAESQRNFDRSLSTLNIVVTSIGVLIGILAIIAGVVIAYVSRSARKWNQIRKSAQKEANIIRTIRDKAEKEVADLRREFDKKPTLPLTTEAPEEYKEKLEELARKIELQEALGIFLRPGEYNMRASDLFYKGKYHLAIEALNKALELKPDYAEAWSNKGVLFQKLNRYQEALDSVNKAIQINPTYYPAWLNKIAFLNGLGHYSEALFASEKAIELNPGDPRAWDNKGITLGNIEGREEDALNAFDKAIELKPDYTQAWSQKAFILVKIRRYNEALEAANKAIELGSPPPQALQHKASALYHLGRYDETLESANKAIELMPKSTAAWNGKALALMKLKRYQEAIDALNRASENDPNSPDTLYNKACLFSLIENKVTALEFLSRAIAVDNKCREMARADEDFKWLWGDEDFIKITAA